MNDLILEQVTKGFGAHVVLQEFSARFPGGQCTCIMGPSGCGKTTLLRLILGLEQPDSGRILGRTFPMAAVFQENRLFEDFSALSNVTAVCPRERRSEAAQHLTALGLGESLHAPVRTLSGGMKRRVAVAGVMAMKPRILVLDEPAAGLDPEGRDDILSEVKEYHKKTGTTVLLVSHSMEDIAKYANRVLVMSNKKIAMYDTVEKVFARAPELLELGLSVPQVTKIFLKLREMGVDVPADVYTIPYAVKMILEAKRRREAGESLVLPREAKKEGGAAGC